MNKSSRVSVSFDPRDYEVLSRVAAEKRVSIAWVIRDAVSDYLIDSQVCAPEPDVASSKKKP